MASAARPEILRSSSAIQTSSWVSRRRRTELALETLLELFVRHPGEVLDRRRLHEEVWRYTFDPGTNVTDVFVGYLRRKLEADGEPRVLHTVRGVGFVLRP